MGLAIFALISLEDGEISWSTVVMACRDNQIILKHSKSLILIIIIFGLVKSS